MESLDGIPSCKLADAESTCSGVSAATLKISWRLVSIRLHMFASRLWLQNSTCVTMADKCIDAAC